jgi:hypothetical protein
MRMTGFKPAGMRVLALFLLATAAGLAGCSSIDQAVGGGSTEEAALPPSGAPAQAPPPETSAPAPSEANSTPSAESGPPAAAPRVPVVTTMMAPPPPAAGMAPIIIQPGADTGTAVGRTVAGLRSQLQTLAGKMGGDAQHLADLKSGSAQAIATYQQATANIQTRLAVGTAPANPELIGQWNTAQGALDTITGNINALSRLAGDIGGDSSAARSTYSSIQATYNTPGGVDEDQRQLNVLSDEASQTMIVADRLMRESKLAIQRQTAYVANERGSLTTLAGAIRAGDYAGPLMGMAPAPVSSTAGPAPVSATAAPASVSATAAPPPAGAPIVTIKFDRSHVAYEKTLYSALSQALASQPKASFSVVGIAPSATRVAANNAERDARAVMRTMGEMGVPPTRMEVSAATDPAASASEVRVYVK